MKSAAILARLSDLLSSPGFPSKATLPYPPPSSTPAGLNTPEPRWDGPARPPGARLQPPTVARMTLSLNTAGEACLQEGRAAPSLALLGSRPAPGWPMPAPTIKREVHEADCASPGSSSPFATTLAGVVVMAFIKHATSHASIHDPAAFALARRPGRGGEVSVCMSPFPRYRLHSYLSTDDSRGARV